MLCCRWTDTVYAYTMLPICPSLIALQISVSMQIDDIFMIWPQNQNLCNILDALNNCHPNLRFTHSLSSTSIDFLDITIYKHQSTLATKTYQKPHNLYQYLHYTSSHPRSVHKELLIGECIRSARTSTDGTNYAAILKLLTARLLKRQYPIRFITKCISLS